MEETFAEREDIDAQGKSSSSSNSVNGKQRVRRFINIQTRRYKGRCYKAVDEDRQSGTTSENYKSK
jgi:hypothetical protein